MGLAYWDLIGKIANRPLGQYLHECFALETPLAERVPMSAYTWYRFPDLNGENAVTFESYPSYVQEIIRTHGFQNIKLSMCDFEPQRYVELVRNIRAAVGSDVDIRVDPHASWGEAQALRFMREVEDYHPEWIEEPVGGRFAHIFRAGHRLRLLSTIPISSHAWLPPLVPHPSPKGRYGDDALDAELDLDALRRWQPADISAPDAYAGPLALKRYYDAARFLGMGIGMHSAYELGPATAIRLHIAAFTFPYEMPYHIVWRTRPRLSALLSARDRRALQPVGRRRDLRRQDGLRPRIPRRAQGTGAGRRTRPRAPAPLCLQRRKGRSPYPPHRTDPRDPSRCARLAGGAQRLAALSRRARLFSLNHRNFNKPLRSRAGRAAGERLHRGGSSSR